MFLPLPDPEPRALDVQRQLAAIGYKFASDKRGYLVLERITPANS